MASTTGKDSRGRLARMWRPAWLRPALRSWRTGITRGDVHHWPVLALATGAFIKALWLCWAGAVLLAMTLWWTAATVVSIVWLVCVPTTRGVLWLVRRARSGGVAGDR